ncbi:MAG: hypothetical protein A2521_00860 [Deltaproteobacteria bacterium RIFOXYD12_FULL_57_12]|nr:MAG: hypothetical protein A2521_00860 [Deltaproteobacteria bacterium RIFOXYD12_FULL_57_12]
MDITCEYDAIILRLLAEETARLLAMLGGRIRCRPGCDDCCRDFSVLPLEAARIDLASAGLPLETQIAIRANAAKPGDHCPFLIDHLCAIYDARPLICRTHGLPIAHIDPAQQTIEVSVCPLNFPPEAELPSSNGLFFLDRFNAGLLDLNSRYAATAGIEATRRQSLRKLASAAMINGMDRGKNGRRP